MSTSIVELPNLGPKSAAMMADAGIACLADLERLGSVKAYVLTKQYHRVSLNLLYAIEGALCGMHWASISRQERARLAMEAEALEEALDNGLEL